MEEGGVGWGGGGGAGVAWGRRGTAPGEGDGAARQVQFEFACGVRAGGARAAWREAVLTARSIRGARRFRVVGCVL